MDQLDLRIRIEKIRESGLSLDRELSQRYLDDLLQAEPATGFRAGGSGSLEARVALVREKDLLFTGTLGFRAEGPCRRCLAPVPVDIPVNFSLNLVRRESLDPTIREPIEDTGEGEIAGTFTPEEALEVPFVGTEVDLEPVVREQILLAVPMRALCNEDCKGLCQVCGADRNVEDCGCDTHVPDPRWAALRNIKLD